MTPDLEDQRPPQSMDIRAITAAVLALVSLLGTIVVVIIGVIESKDVQLASTLLGGFTTTFGAYALGIQSETRA